MLDNFEREIVSNRSFESEKFVTIFFLSIERRETKSSERFRLGLCLPSSSFFVAKQNGNM